MKFLSWYTTILVTYCLVALLIGVLDGTSPSVTVDLWSIALFIPVLVFNILIMVEKKLYK